MAMVSRIFMTVRMGMTDEWLSTVLDENGYMERSRKQLNHLKEEVERFNRKYFEVSVLGRLFDYQVSEEEVLSMILSHYKK